MTLSELRDEILGNGRFRYAVHGNGFIMIDLRNGSRAHFFGDKRIPSQSVYSGIHDHRFGFTSDILKGRMVNVTYCVVPKTDGPFMMHAVKAREGEDTGLHPIGIRAVAFPRHVVSVHPGGDYQMAAKVFHETFTPEPTITVMTKTTIYHDHAPMVLVPTDLEPDNAFNRNAIDSRLIEDILVDMLA